MQEAEGVLGKGTSTASTWRARALSKEECCKGHFDIMQNVEGFGFPWKADGADSPIFL